MGVKQEREDYVVASPDVAEPPSLAAGSDRRVSWRVSGLTVAAGLVACCVAVGLSASLAPRALVGLGIPDTGVLTDWGRPAVKAIFDLAASLTVGWLLAAAFLVPAQSRGIFDVGGYRAIRAAGLCATVWAAAAAALVPLTISDSSGFTLGQVLRPDALETGLDVFETARGALAAALIAAAVAVACRFVLRPATASAVLVLAVAGLAPVAAAGHSAQSQNHDFATDTMLFHVIGVAVWVGGLVALLGLARQQTAHLSLITARYSAVAGVAFALVAVSGIGNALVRFTYVSDLWSTDYGLLILAKTVLTAALGWFGWQQRRRSVAAIAAHGDRRPLLRLAASEVLLMAVVLGIAVTLGRTASPTTGPTAPSELSQVLGFDLAGPGSLWQMLTVWRFDLIFGTVSLAAAVIYLLGVRRLRGRGVGWPPGRTCAWLFGCALVVVGTSSGLGAYGQAQFSVHMVGHMVLAMMAPILLVLGAPTTLALRALPVTAVPGARAAVVGLVRSKLLRRITHPLVVFPLFVGSFYALYFTGLFDVMITSHLGHLTMKLHFLVMGYLYYWVIIGVDPAPRRLPPMVKLGLLLAALPFHSFFGLALMNSRSLVGSNWYRTLELPWVPDLLADQRLGGAIAWGATEIPTIVVVLAMLAQWSRSDAREAARADRRPGGKLAPRHTNELTPDEPDAQATSGPPGPDEELQAFNNMFTHLAAQDQADRKKRRP